MNNINFTISPMQARKLALSIVHASAAEFTWQKLVDNNGSPMYELELSVDGMNYSLCIDANDGSILGFLSEPRCA